MGSELGPIEVWVIRGERYLFNGNHRFQAALQASVEIPADLIRIVEKTCWRPVEVHMLEGVRHSPHREAPERTVELIAPFATHVLESEHWSP